MNAAGPDGRLRGLGVLPWAAAGLVLVLALALTAGLVSALHVADTRAALATDERYRLRLEETARDKVDDYVTAVREIAAAVGAQQDIDQATFEAIAAPLGRTGLPGVSHASLFVPVRTDRLARVQDYWRVRGNPSLVLRPNGPAPEHWFSVLGEPLDGGRLTLGVDAAASAELTAALSRQRPDGAVVVTAPYVLLRDRDLPPARQQRSFAFLAPIPDAPGTVSDGVPRGWVSVGVRGQDFVSQALERSAQGLSAVSLSAVDGKGHLVRVAAAHDRAAPGARTETLTLPVADRTWTLALTPTALGAAEAGADRRSERATLAGGILAGLLLAAVVFLVTSGRRRALNEVQRATARLSETERESRRQADLLAAVLESVSDGVAVVDRDGAFLVQNSASHDLLRVGTDSDDPDDWSAHYGLFELDGDAPYPTDRLPLVRALAGETVADVEILLRRRDADLVISVSARPLTGDHAPDGAVAIYRDVTERKRTEQQLSRAALHDPLTGLPNRLLLREHLDAALTRAARYGRTMALLYLDLNNFKAVNDTLGHAAGDELLAGVATRLRDCLRDSDIAARLGGDEFVVVCENLADPAEASLVADRIRAALTTRVPAGPGSIDVSVSIGVATSTGDRSSADLLAEADTAMYESKSARRHHHLHPAPIMEIGRSRTFQMRQIP